MNNDEKARYLANIYYVLLADTVDLVMNPAIGPDAPMSIRARLVTIGDFILINAPNVPMIVGAGMKYGSVARTPCFCEVK